MSGETKSSLDCGPENATSDGTTRVQIEVTPAEGGALLRMSGPTASKSRVVEGDPTSDSFRRKVQRTIVNWTKRVYFTAPPRAKKDVPAPVPTP